MCGRFALKNPKAIKASFGLEEMPDLPPRYNIAPSQDIAIVRFSPAGRHLSLAHWGLIPSWSKESDKSYSTINARAETVDSKPSFRVSFRDHRCLIPADGFFEWETTTAGKQPHLIRRSDGAPFAMAGLWSRWRGAAAGEPVESCTILTCPANELVSRLHDRMPVIVPASRWDRWLDPATDPAALGDVLVAAPADDMESIPVSRAVNSSANDSPECVRPVDVQSSLW